MKILMLFLFILTGTFVTAQNNKSFELVNISKTKNPQKDSTLIVVSLSIKDTAFQVLEVNYGYTESYPNLLYKRLIKEINNDGELFLSDGIEKYKVENNIVNIPANIPLTSDKKTKYFLVTSKSKNGNELYRFSKIIN